MLKIQRRHLDTLQSVVDDSVVKSIADDLREDYPSNIVRVNHKVLSISEIPVETVQILIREGIDRARGYGITFESSLAAFVTLMFVTAPNFDDHPHVKLVLTDAAIPPDDRLDTLWDRTTEQDWEEIEQRYDPSAWMARRSGS